MFQRVSHLKLRKKKKAGGGVGRSKRERQQRAVMGKGNTRRDKRYFACGMPFLMVKKKNTILGHPTNCDKQMCLFRPVVRRQVLQARSLAFPTLFCLSLLSLTSLKVRLTALGEQRCLLQDFAQARCVQCHRCYSTYRAFMSCLLMIVDKFCFRISELVSVSF